VGEIGSEPRAIDLWLKRRRPAERAQAPEVPEWMLLVCYRAGGNEYAARLGLSSGDIALRVDRLLAATRMGNRVAAAALFACLHAEWGQWRIVRRSSADVAWEAVFRYLAPLAAGAGSDPASACAPAKAPVKP
jgi:hypothetical protein